MYRSSRIVYRRSSQSQALGWGGGSLIMPSTKGVAFIRRASAAVARQQLFTPSLSIVPELSAPDASHASHLDHLRDVDDHLRRSGILKVNLASPDPKSEYLELLLSGLHRHQGHRLPISHSASTGWFWDVRPNAINNTDSTSKEGNSSSSISSSISSTHRARSETMDDFPWHTDCSYEDPPPRFFALQVLQHDRMGGGTLSLMNVARLSERLSAETKASLARPEFEIGVPPEFTKDTRQKSIIGSILTNGSSGPEEEGTKVMRFRADILKPLTDRAEAALGELQGELQQAATLHLASGDMPKGTVLLVDNRRWLHARNHVKDPNRHLRRVRWDAVPFK